LVLAFTVYPVLYAIYVSVHRFDFTLPGNPFVGLKNYIYVVTSYFFETSWRISVIFTISSVVITVGIATVLALILNEKFRSVRLMQVMILLPWGIPLVVSGAMWKWIYHGTYGVLNGVLKQLGLIPSYVVWLSDPTYAIILLVNSYIWCSVSLPTLLLLTGLQSVPAELYEAAKVDGAGALTRFRKITFKWLLPTYQMVFILSTLLALTHFDLVYVITSGGPFDTTAMVSYYNYKVAFTFLNFGAASAFAIIVAVVAIPIIVAYLRLLRAEEIYVAE
jgi:multiple sugar transport system permease protein